MTTVIWDIDDVLNPLMRAWFHHAWLPAHPDCRVRTYEGLAANPPHDVLGVAREVYLASLDAFRLSGAYEQMAPVPEVLAWFDLHGAKCRHVALTATPLVSADRSAAWLMRHFGRWIRVFAFVPSPRAGTDLPQYDATKSDFLRWFGKGDLLVDDSPANVQAARDVGRDAILVPQPWNGGSQTLADVLAALTEYVT
jgi:hypothetical protein